jgi:hypothetical protein
MLPLEIEQALYGFIQSHILFVGDELGVFDKMANGEAHTLSELGKLTKTREEALERLLLAGAVIGLIEKKENRFQVPEHLHPFLSKRSEKYCGEIFPHFREVSTLVFRHLREAVLEGTPQWKRLSGVPTDSTPFDWIYQDPKRLQDFVSTMWAIGYSPAKELVEQFPLDRYHTLIDLGGCSGSFAVAALQKYDLLKATVFDLSPIKPYLIQKRGEYDLGSRLGFVEGDFFTDVLPEGDVYALGYILSDWTREAGTKLLRKIFKALPKGGAVLILEKLFNENKIGPISTAMMNIAMLLETGGGHYSGAEYVAWLREIGFERCKVFRSSGDKHMVVGEKP